MLLLLLACIAFGCVKPAPLAVVAPASVPTLGPDEGLVVVQVDSDATLVDLEADGRPVAASLGAGHHAWLVRMPQGRHAWTEIAFVTKPQERCRKTPTARFDPRKDLVGIQSSEYEFEVVAGAINYPGELILRAGYGYCGAVSSVRIRNRNHSAMALRALAKSHGPILERFPLRYGGRSRDGFLEYFDRERARVAKAAARDPKVAPGVARGSTADGGAGDPIRDATAPSAAGSGVVVGGQPASLLYDVSGVDLVAVSPSGRWVVARGQLGEVQGLMVQRVGLGLVEVARQFKRVDALVWEGPDELLVRGCTCLRDLNRYYRVKLSVVEDRIQVESQALAEYGGLVDARPQNPGVVIWEYEYRGRNSVHRVELDELGNAPRVAGRLVRNGETLATIEGSAHVWVLDRSGIPRAALRRDEHGYSILSRRSEKEAFEVVHRFDDGDDRRKIVPVGMVLEDETFMVLARAGRDFVGLHRFDPATGKLGEAVFVHESADVLGVDVDPYSGEPIGVAYGEEGEVRTHYFPAYRDRFVDKLDDRWDRDSIFVASASRYGDSFVFFVSNATNPGEFFYRERNGRVDPIAKIAAKIDREQLSPVEAFHVKSKDGVEVEAFLSIPKSTSGRVPLVVMPHGGPIGVHDVRAYDPLVQYLASWGFAVLQVNYRGSSGYGLEFEKLGKKQWAKGIEDDIDAAVEHAMTLPAIDPERMCIVGGSYGGFSALASIVRHRDRYRCAVTISGVTDVPLIADSSDTADSKASMAFFEEYVGDLETEREKLLAISPAYQTETMEAPILIIQGTADRRVDPDHAHRLIAMLELRGKPNQSMFVENAAHSFTTAQSVSVAVRLRRFLTEHLKPGIPFDPDPITPSEKGVEFVHPDG